MAITNTRLATTIPTQVFRAVETEAITVIYICNTTASPVTVSVYCVDSSDSSGAGDSNMIYSQLEITANDTYVIDTEKLILSPNDIIEVESSVPDSITVTVSSIVV